MLTFEQIQASRRRCAELGTDKEFQEFVRNQTSCISGRRPCVYAHVRRAAFSGTGMKPEFSGVPLTDYEHQMQHRSGEAAILHILTGGFVVTPQTAKEWFDKEAEKYRQMFIKEKTK